MVEVANLTKGVAPLAKEVAHLEIKEVNWEDH
jgi:hypothetical protein